MASWPWTVGVTQTFSLAPGTPTTTVLVASPTVVSVGQPFTFTATVSPAGATGTVSFLEGTTVLGVSPVVNGVATLVLTLPVGAHTIHEHYSGD